MHTAQKQRLLRKPELRFPVNYYTRKGDFVNRN